MKLPTIRAVNTALLLTFLVLGGGGGPSSGPTSVQAFLPIVGDLAKGVIGRLQDVRKGIRQHIRQRMCEFAKHGQIYVAPCEQQGQQHGGQQNGQKIIKEEVIIEEYQPRRPGQQVEEIIIEEYRPGGGGGRKPAPPKPQPNQRQEEIDFETQASESRPIGRVPPDNRGRPPPRPKPAPKPEVEVVEEQEDEVVRVKPEKVAKEEADDNDDDQGDQNDQGNGRNPFPGNGKPDKSGKLRQGPAPGPKPVPKPKPVPPGGKPAPKPRPGQGDPCQTNEGVVGLCMPATYCYSQYSTVEDYRANMCEFSEGSPFANGGSGICCPQEEPVLDAFDLPIRVPQIMKPTSKIRFISLEDINKAATEAQTFIQKEIDKERNLIRRGMVQRQGSMQSMHQSFFGDFDPVQFKLTKGGFISLVTTVIIKNKFKLSKEEARDGLYKYSIENTDLEQFCIKEPDCIQSKYRSIDGSCNNLQRPLWGKSNTAFERLLPPEYADGLHEPRTKSMSGQPLPSARKVSHDCATARNMPEPRYTLMLMQWGQFIDHDLTLASSTRAATGQGVVCCDETKQTPVDHHACFPILIPADDPFYSKFNQKCMHLVRNSPSPRSGCSLGHREQMNTLSHIMDASMVYGSTPERMKQLRTFRDGKLKTSSIHNAEFMPQDRRNNSEECAINEAEQRKFKCFIAGDVRVNEQTGLTMLHNLLVREHNRVADKLKQLNPNGRRYNDEILFQEARRIVAAEIQHITYNEWLPIVLGRKTMKLFGILPKPFGFTKDYNPRVNPNILNEFATAAYRFHSLIQGTFVLLDNDGQVKHRFKLHTLFNNPKSIYMPNAFDQYLNGFSTEPAQTFDKFFTDEITNHLFEEPKSGFGMDLIALNIQRGRDHGLPGYNSYRKICGQQALRSFKDLEEFMQPGSAAVLAKLYKHVDDIDLFIGGAHEVSLPDALIGPTFACIVAEQARRGKVGDRYWYENGGLPQSFKPNQLSELRKSSLAALICENADTIQKVQPLAFLRPGGFNEKVPCEKIARMDLLPWKNEKLWE